MNVEQAAAEHAVRPPSTPPGPASPPGPTRCDPLSQVFHRLDAGRRLAVGWAARFVGEHPSPDALRRHVQARLAGLPALTHRVGEGSRPSFVPVCDRDLDLRVHVRELVLTGRQERWQDCVREVVGRPLPTAPRPPWDLWIVHGYSELPEYVLVFRIHHAMEDGAGHHYVLQTLFTPRIGPQRAPAESGGHAQGRPAERISPRAVLGIVRDLALSQRGSTDWPVLRRPPTGELSAASGAVATRRLVGLSRTVGTDIGTVFLAALTGAMRAVALAEDERLAPLTLLWPLTVRAGSERGAMGNFLTMACVRLPCDEVRPGARLASIGRQLAPEVVEPRMRTSRTLMRLSPRPLTHWMLRRLMSPRHASLTGTYFPTAMPQPAFGQALLDGALGLGAPLPGQLCHLTLLRRRAECTLSVVHDTAFARGAELPERWLAALEELEADV